MDRPVAYRLDPNTKFLTDPGAQTLCDTLEDAGFAALFVGGCVRNAVLGAPASDIDIATDATPDQVMDLLERADIRAIPTGIDHGTITAIIDDTPYEITTFRRDMATDGRRAVVAFSKDIAEDARRRDFTMNALYADKLGLVHDPLNGIDDALQGRVRFIEDADQRIREDYLRTLRFFRFHAWYGSDALGWDAEALDGIARNLDGLDTLSAERVGAEMRKLLAAPDPTPALSVMSQTGVLGRILPGADVTFVGPYVHLEQAAGLLPNPIARLAALGGQDVTDRLRLSRAEQRELDSIRNLSTSTYPVRATGYLGGKRAGSAALLLRSAYANSPFRDGDLNAVSEGATAEFPLSAKDLPHLTGPDLGAELKRLKAVWLASDLVKTRDDLLPP